MTTVALSRVATLDEREVLKDAAFKAALRELADGQNRDFREVERYAKECLDELSVRPADRYLGWVAALARFMYTRSFEPEFDVNWEALRTLKSMAESRPLVFLWSHKSHLDAFVFMRTLYDAGFRPQPLSFAGINMAFAGFGALAKHSGAIFLRRTFKDDDVYKLVLQHFIDYLVARRVPLSWSIEGTRSRTGLLMPPKLGLIQWVVDAYHRAQCDDALLVPVAISFDQIPEIDDFIAMQRGLPKRKETLRWFIGYIAGMKAKYGKIYVRFAEPVSLSESVPVADALVRGDTPDRAQVHKLAFEVCNRIEHIKPITPIDLITLVLMAANDRALDEGQIRDHAVEIIDLIQRWALPTAANLDPDGQRSLSSTLETLTETELLEAHEMDAAPVYRIMSGKQLAAAYYRNTIVHYFLSSAIAEVALATTSEGRGKEGVLDTAMALRDLLKFEFFFKTKAAFRSDVAAYLDYRYPSWCAGKSDLSTEKPPLFGHGILRSFVEAYGILAELLVRRGEQIIAESEQEALIGGCLRHGEEMLLRKEISTEAALSQPMFAHAIRLANHRGLLRGDGGRQERRRAFADEIAGVLNGIALLQTMYDRHLGGT